MTKNKSTKRALLLSALSLLLCVSMLVGSTFAWFTDSVTSGKNKIVAGNLDVELEYYKNGKWNTVDKATDLFTGDLWEPGHTEVVYLKMSNLGSLALKYQLGINVASETASISVETNKEFKLSDFIKFSVVGNVNGETAPFADRATAVAEALKVADGNKKINAGYSDTGFMLAKQAPIYMALVVYMPETVGNEANYKKDAPVPTIELGVNLMATQKDYESDSFGIDYDAKASEIVTDITKLQAAINAAEEGGTVFIASGNYTLPAQINVNKSVNIVGLGNVTITAQTAWHMIMVSNYYGTTDEMVVNMQNINLDGNNKAKAGIYAKYNVDLTLNNVTVKGTTWDDIQIDNANTHSDGKYYNNTKTVVRANNVTVEDVSLIALPTAPSENTGVKYDNEAHFYYDPATCSIGKISKDARCLDQENLYINGDNSAPAGTTFFANDDAQLAAAIASASTTGETVIVLADGTFSEDITLDARYMEQKGDLVFKAATGATPVIAGTATLGYYENRVGAKEWAANVTFEGITFDHAEAEKHSLSVQSLKSVTLKKCTIIGDGEYGIGSQSGNNTGASLIEECTFVNAGMQIYGNFGTGLVIDKCTFDESQVNVGGGNGVTIQNCTFDKTLTDANNGDSFYVIRSPKSGTPVTVKNCEINVDSTVNGLAVAADGKALAILHNRHATAAWTITDVAITMTDAALAQPELKVIETVGGAMNATNLTVNGGAVPTALTKVSDGLYKDEKGNFYIYNAEGLAAANQWMIKNYSGAFYGKTYNIMSDIDAASITWKGKHYTPDSDTFKGITFNGNGHTIKNLKIEGNGMFTGATKGSVIKNITFDNATVTGGSHHNGVVWGEAYGSLTLEKVNVINSTVNGGCNVGGLVGRNSESHAVFTFTDCSVKNTTINATKVADYAGASAFLGNALKLGNSCSATVIFNGNNVAEGNTLNSVSGLTGGGIYTVSEYGTATWENPTVVSAFTNLSN